MTMDALYGVRMVGPLAPHARGFADELTRLGFTTFSARGQLGMAVRLSCWLAEAGLGLAGLAAVAGGSVPRGRRAARGTPLPSPQAAGAPPGDLRRPRRGP